MSALVGEAELAGVQAALADEDASPAQERGGCKPEDWTSTGFERESQSSCATTVEATLHSPLDPDSFQDAGVPPTDKQAVPLERNMGWLPRKQ